MDDFKLPTQEDMAAYVQQAQQTLEELKPAMLAWISLLQRDPLAALHQLIGVADYALGKAIDTAKGGWNWLFDHTIIALFLLCVYFGYSVYNANKALVEQQRRAEQKQK